MGLGDAVLRLMVGVGVDVLVDLVLVLLGLELAAARGSQPGSLAREALFAAGADGAFVVGRPGRG
jgi:hypothetical protein